MWWFDICSTRINRLSINNDDSDTEIYSLSSSDDDNENTATVAQSDIQSQAPVVLPSNCDVCLFNPRDPIALVPCGHARSVDHV